MITRYFKAVVILSLLMNGLQAAATQGDLDQHLAAFAKRPGVVLKDGALDLYETHAVGEVAMLAANTAASAVAAYYFLTSEKSFSSTGICAVFACLTGYGALRIVDAYWKHNTPPLLCTLSKDGFKVAGKQLVSWQQVGDCDIEQYTAGLGDITIPLHLIWYSPAVPAPFKQDVETLKIYNPYGSELLTADSRHVSLTPRELKVLIEAFKSGANLTN